MKLEVMGNIFKAWTCFFQCQAIDIAREIGARLACDEISEGQFETFLADMLWFTKKDAV